MRSLQVSPEEKARRDELFSSVWRDLKAGEIDPHKARHICVESGTDWNAFGNWCTRNGHETPRLQHPGEKRSPKRDFKSEISTNYAGIVAAVDEHREFPDRGVTYCALKHNACLSSVHSALKSKASYDKFSKLASN